MFRLIAAILDLLTAIVKRVFVLALILVVVGAVFVGIFVVGARGPTDDEKRADVQRLEKGLGVLEKLGVTYFAQDAGASAIYYRRGKFYDAGIDTLKPLATFDDQTLRDFAAVSAAVAGTSVKVDKIEQISYRLDGKLSGASFHLEPVLSSYAYVYSPAYQCLPPNTPDEREHTAIDKNWFLLWVDRN